MKILLAVILVLIYFSLIGLLIWIYIVPKMFSLFFVICNWEISISLVCLFLVYWLLIRITWNMKSKTRTYLIAGYACIHLLSWILMDIPVRHEFKQMVKTMHKEALADPERKRWVFPSISENAISVKSIAPVPFVLVTTQMYQIGPLWGLGEVYIYVFNGRTLNVVLQEIYYLS